MKPDTSGQIILISAMTLQILTSPPKCVFQVQLCKVDILKDRKLSVELSILKSNRKGAPADSHDPWELSPSACSSLLHNMM